MANELTEAQLARVAELRRETNSFVLRFMLGLGAVWAVVGGAILGVTSYLS